MSQNYEIIYPIYQSDIAGTSVCNAVTPVINTQVVLNTASPYYNGTSNIIDFSYGNKFSIFRQLSFVLSNNATVGGCTFTITGYSNGVFIAENVTIAVDASVATTVNYYDRIVTIIPTTINVNEGTTLNVSGNYSNGCIGPVTLNTNYENDSYASVILFESPTVVLGEEETATTCTTLFANNVGQGKSFLQYLACLGVLSNNQGLSKAGSPCEVAVFQVVNNFVYFQFNTASNNAGTLIIAPTTETIYLLQT